MTGPKPRLSATILNGLGTCAMTVYWSYVKGIKRPPGVAATVGKSVHGSAEDDLRNVIENETLLDDADVQDNAAFHFEYQWDQGVELNEDEESEGKDKVKGEAKDKAIRLSTLHHAEVAPEIKPTHVEERFDVVVKGCSHDLSGYVDVIEGGEKLVVRDTKTTSRKPEVDAAHKSLQLQLYALACEVGALGVSSGKPVGKRKPAALYLDFLVGLKKSENRVSLATAPPAVYTPLLLRIQKAAEIMDKGTFYPVEPGHWKCCAKWCGYWQDICPHGRRAQTIVPVTAVFAPPE